MREGKRSRTHLWFVDALLSVCSHDRDRIPKFSDNGISLLELLGVRFLEVSRRENSKIELQIYTTGSPCHELRRLNEVERSGKELEWLVPKGGILRDSSKREGCGVATHRLVVGFFL